MFLLTSAATLLMTSGVAMGEAFVRQDRSGRPIQTIQTPVLPAGLYEFDTTNLVQDPDGFHADTVLAVRTGGGVDAITIDGADECTIETGDVDLGRSCVRVTLSEPQAVWIWVWARHQIFQGETDVRYQRLDAETPVRGATECANWVSDPWGCWKVLATEVPFGGMSLMAVQLGDNLDEVARFETTELPGAELAELPSEHAIMLLDGASAHHLLPSPAYEGSFRGAPYSHHRQIAGTAEWTGYLHAAREAAGGDSGFDAGMPLVLVGPLGAHTGGPYRVLRNDLVEHYEPGEGDDWSVIFRGKDSDRDGLGEDLEALLKTCDSSSSPDANGKQCSALPGCSATAFDAELCRAACRDSDQDAMRDDYELFGLATYNGELVSGMELARYGANPAHFDVMVELDNLCWASSSGRWWQEPPATCEIGLANAPAAIGFPTPVPGTITAAEYTARAGDADLLGVPSPPPESASDPLCWVYGVRSDYEYFDPESLAGIADVYASIPGFDNRSGVDGIAVHFDAGIPSAPNHRGIYGNWGGAQFETLLYECNSDTFAEIHADYIEPPRRWLFRHAHRNPAVHGGRSDVPALRFFAGGSGWVLAHELGHAGGLHHGGPNGDPRAAANHNPIYRSRINYLYEGLSVLRDNRTDVTFSDGSFPGALNPLDLDEACPFGEGKQVPAVVLDKLPGAEQPFDEDSNCQPVDWNDDGVITGRVHAQIRDIHRMSKRTYFTESVDGESQNIRFHYLAGVGDLAVGDSSLVMAAVDANLVEVETDDGETEDVWRNTPTIRFTGSFDCTECEDLECAGGCPDCGGICNGCWRTEMGESVILTESLDGPPIVDAHSLAVTYADGRYVWVAHRDSGVSWGLLDESSGSSHAEAELAEVNPSTKTYETPLALATETSDGVVLAYREADGTVMIARGTSSGGGVDWTVEGPAQHVDGHPLVAAPETSVGLAVADGRLILTVATIVPLADGESTNRLDIFETEIGGNDWAPLSVIESPTKGAAQLAYTGYPSNNRLIVSMQTPGLRSLRAESLPGNLAEYTSESQGTYSIAFANPIAWDARTGLLPGLRGWYAETQCLPGGCGDGLQCVTAQGASATADTEKANQCRPPAMSGVRGPQVEAQQFLLPFHDGVLPVNFYDMDDRPHMRRDYCTTLRNCDGEVAYAGACIPSEGRELDPAGVAYGSALCSPPPAIEGTQLECTEVWEQD